MVYAGIIAQDQSARAAVSWFTGDFIGIITLAPLLLVRGWPHLVRYMQLGHGNGLHKLVPIATDHRPDLYTVLAAMLALLLVFGAPRYLELDHGFALAALLLLLPLTVVALRYGLRGAVLAVALLAAAPVGVLEFDGAGSCRYINSIGCTLTGRTSEQALGIHFLDFVHPDDREQSELAWITNRLSATVQLLEFRLCSNLWCAAHWINLHPANSSLDGAIVVLTDSTVRRQQDERLKGRIRESDALARIGGDEFAVIMPEITNCESVVMVADQLVASLSEVFELPQGCAHISGSIGIALYPTHADTVETLMQCADFAMYSAKHAGKNQVQVGCTDSHEKSRSNILSELARI